MMRKLLFFNSPEKPVVEKVGRGNFSCNDYDRKENSQTSTAKFKMYHERDSNSIPLTDVACGMEPK